MTKPRLLKKILSREVIMPLFRQYTALPCWRDVNIDELHNEVHENYIIVLALLILLERGRDIIQFRNEATSDATLPLRLTYTEACPDLRLGGQASTRLRCFRNPPWGFYMKEEFYRKQWQLNVPYMEMDKMGLSFIAKHTNFESDVILPWCRSKQIPPHMSEAPRSGYGGYSRVDPVYIHPDYHGFRAPLEKDLEDLYRNEIEHLKSFNGTVCPHLVTLLTTFTHKEKRNFLFPWATCSLESYWETEKPQPRSVDNIRWFSKQLVGLAEAVKTIHYPPHMEHKYGRHSDLKPDNILWYRTYGDDPNGILVVSDMGFTVAHHTLSRSNDHPATVARTPEYRPPELDTESNSTISRKSDIWPLGCIFLEMVIWFLGGKEEREGFKKSRKEEEPKYGAMTYTFFTLTQREIQSDNESGEQSKFHAEVKTSVQDCMNRVRRHENRSQFSDAIVSVIQESMIVVDPSGRDDMLTLHQKFSDINHKCTLEENYCIPSTHSDGL
ncbi:hypothetical protein RRF57_009530 [Xylaria bambusicola]|uniref:Protein kinase domain-containing protein n=1 Tax=Xylaria bambusicola TaxID=326684 RepID=A0AAN7ZC06_9PEZI